VSVGAELVVTSVGTHNVVVQIKYKIIKNLIRKLPAFNYVQFQSVSGKYKHLLSASVVHQMAAHIILEVAIWVWPGFTSPSFWKTGSEFTRFVRSKLRISLPRILLSAVGSGVRLMQILCEVSGSSWGGCYVIS
jgi:hypothetical protein